MIKLFICMIILEIIYGVSQGLSEGFTWNVYNSKYFGFIKDSETYHMFRSIELLAVILSTITMVLIFRYFPGISNSTLMFKLITLSIFKHFIFQTVYRAAFVLERGQKFNDMSRKSNWELPFGITIPYPSNFIYAISIPVSIGVMLITILT